MPRAGWDDVSWSACVAAFLVGCAAYAQTAGSEFAFDDTYAVAGNADVVPGAGGRAPRPLAAWARDVLTRHDFWGQPLTSRTSHKSWRPLTTASLAWSAALAPPAAGGGPSAAPFHALNAVLHGACCSLVLAAVRVAGAALGVEEAQGARLASTAAALFALHPAHADAAASVVGRAELAACALFMAGVVLYCTGRRSAAVCAALAAALAKETGVTALGAYVVIELFELTRGDTADGGKVIRPRRTWWLAHRHRRALARVLGCCAAGAAYVGARSAVTGGSQLVEITRHVENPAWYVRKGDSRVLAVAHLHALYVGILAWPARLSADWSFECVTPATSVWDVRNAYAVVTYAAFASLVAVSLRQGCARGRLRVLAAVGLGAGPFLPASNVLFPVGTYIAERLLYTPSVGFCVLLADALDALSRRAPRLARLALLLTCVAYGARLQAHNAAWTSEETLFTAALATCPGSAKVQMNAGILARRQEDWALAERRFNRAREIEPTYCEPVYWLGINAISDGRAQEGIGRLRDALDCVWVRNHAADALNKVYAELVGVAKTRVEAAARSVEWADILVRLERPEEACATLHSAADTLDEAGLHAPARDALERCKGVAAGAPAGSCLARQAQVYAAADSDFASAAAKRAATAYLAGAEECVGGRMHQRLVHALQKADSYDPALHHAWAKCLLAEEPPRASEALTHLNVAQRLWVARIEQHSPSRAAYDAVLAVLETAAAPPVSSCEARVHLAVMRAQLARAQFGRGSHPALEAAERHTATLASREWGVVCEGDGLAAVEAAERAVRAVANS